MTMRFKTLALVGLCLSVTLAGCGRKGGWKTGSAVQQADAAVDPAVAAPVQPEAPQSDKPFFLDFMIR